MSREQWPDETIVTNEVDVKNLDEKGILLEMLKELKKINLYNALNSKDEITNEDIGE